MATSVRATTAAAAQAGVVEEISYVAVPVGFALYLAARHLSRWAGLRSWSTWEPAARWGLFIAVLCTVLARVSIHAHQGPINAGMVAAWTLVNVLVFLESGSILPLILAHFFFDAIAIRSDLTGIDSPAWLGIAAGITVVRAYLTWTHRQRRESPGAATLSR
ncbi:MAG: CPBP family intramembrane glutamic endopeptidase [Leifsonia sp.]